MADESEMVERIARALYEYDTIDPAKPWDGLPATTKSYLRGAARAALVEARRESTEAMLTAGVLTVAHAICRKQHELGMHAACVMDEEPDRPACTDANCRIFEIARVAITALSSGRREGE